MLGPFATDFPEVGVELLSTVQQKGACVPAETAVLNAAHQRLRLLIITLPRSLALIYRG
jgi:hypothetical protein